MSTRSVIARAEGDGWKGVYHHSDGYPTGLGCYIFRAIHHQFKGKTGAFLKYALFHDAGWSHIFPASVIKRDQPGREIFDGSRPAAQCYCHGYFARRDKVKPGDGGGIQRHDNHGFDIEWVYVLDPEARTMAVLRHHGGGCPDYARLKLPPPRTEGTCINLAGVVSLDDPEPDWIAIECGPNLEWCHHYRCLHGAPGCDQDCPYCHGTSLAPKERLLSSDTWVDSILPPVAMTGTRFF